MLGVEVAVGRRGINVGVAVNVAVGVAVGRSAEHPVGKSEKRMQDNPTTIQITFCISRCLSCEQDGIAR